MIEFKDNLTDEIMFTANIDFNGEPEFCICVPGDPGDFYLNKTETVQLRDYLNKFLLLTEINH